MSKLTLIYISVYVVHMCFLLNFQFSVPLVVFLSLYQFPTILVTLQQAFICDNVSPPNLFFFLDYVGYIKSFELSCNFRVILTISTTISTVILIKTTFNLWRIDAFTTLNILIHKRGTFSTQVFFNVSSSIIFCSLQCNLYQTYSQEFYIICFFYKLYLYLSVNT